MPMSTVAYNSALAACEAGKEWKYALELYDEMQSSVKLAPDTLSYDAVLAACHAAGQLHKAEHVVADMQAHSP